MPHLRTMRRSLLSCFAFLTACAHSLPPIAPTPQLVKVKIPDPLLVCGPFDPPPPMNMQAQLGGWISDVYPRAIVCESNANHARALNK